MAESGRLGVEVNWQLDQRLSEVAVNAGAKELQMQRGSLFQALDAWHMGKVANAGRGRDEVRGQAAKGRQVANSCAAGTEKDQPGTSAEPNKGAA